MKKISMLVALIAGSFLAFATEITQQSNSVVNSASETSTSVRVYYDGKAYSSAQDGLIPSADGYVTVYWTSEDCSVNGDSGYTPYKIQGTYSMYFDRKYKEMTHYVSYKGERYFFQI